MLTHARTNAYAQDAGLRTGWLLQLDAERKGRRPLAEVLCLGAYARRQGVERPGALEDGALLLLLSSS